MLVANSIIQDLKQTNLFYGKNFTILALRKKSIMLIKDVC